MSQLNLVIGHAKVEDYDEEKEKEEERERKKYLLKALEDKFKVCTMLLFFLFGPFNVVNAHFFFFRVLGNGFKSFGK